MRRFTGFLLAVALALAAPIASAALSVSLSASPANGTAPFNTTLSWNVTGATADTVCLASGSWTGTKPLSGSQPVSNLLSNASYVLACATPAIPGTPAVPWQATLHWTPPNQNTDGSALTNLSGYRVLYGASAASLNQVVQVTGGGVSSYIVDILTSGTTFFAVRAYNSSGVESANSNTVSKSGTATPATPGTAAETASKILNVSVLTQPNPPTLLTADTVAYKQDNSTHNLLKVAKIGTVPLNKPCVPATSPFTGKPIDYMGLNVLADRMVAKLSEGITTRPSQVLAKCEVRM